MAQLSPAANPAGYVPRLLSAAAFVTNRATEESLAELRLTQERSAVLGVLVHSPADQPALAEASGLGEHCVRDCLFSLQCCGYAEITADGRWSVTEAGKEIHAKAAAAEARLLARSNEDVDGLRQELHALIRALTPPASDPQ